MYVRMIGFIVALLLAFFAGKAIAAEADNVTHTTVSCTNTTGAALAAGEARQAVLFINNGAETIWLRIGEASVANEGIRLNALGGSYAIAEIHGNRDSEAINCITASGTAVLLVVVWDNL